MDIVLSLYFVSIVRFFI